ncbi:unnamed protein product [Larinioides sclopetarius]|uniref:DUF7153 domain-containing protein n=2 Tax=Larinioides sclopetarius TaxID=280406 RepID=A0AAV1Z0D3_9ARAC
MPPYSNGAVNQLHKLSMRRGGPPGAGTTSPLALQRSEFEDFANAYRPTLDVSRTSRPEPPKPVEETKGDFGRSIKKLIKRPQGSPSVQNKNKKSIQRTPTLAPSTSGHQERERSVTSDVRPISEKKPKRPVSANIETTLLPPQPKTSVGPTMMPSMLDTNLVKTEIPLPPQQSPVLAPGPKTSKPPVKVPKNENGDHLRLPPPESATAPPVVVHTPAVPKPIPAKKKVSIQEDNRRSGTDFSSDAHCLIISGNNIGRFFPPRHNPDPVLSMRVIPIPERKYHVILEFEESPDPPQRMTSTSGLMVVAPDVYPSPRDQTHLFSWLRESHVAAVGMLLGNVEKMTDFPFVTYLVVNGGRHELSQKLQGIEARQIPESLRRRLFLAGYEEPVTITKPPLTFPEKPSSEKTGYVVSLYQVLPGEDGVKFEQNWVMWTGARQLYRTAPDYMGLKRISVHKSVLPTKVINYCLLCEFSNIMDYLTDACVMIDHLRARCCGFTGIYRILDSL